MTTNNLNFKLTQHVDHIDIILLHVSSHSYFVVLRSSQKMPEWLSGSVRKLSWKTIMDEKLHLCNASQRLYHPCVAPHFALLGMLSTTDLLCFIVCMLYVPARALGMANVGSTCIVVLDTDLPKQIFRKSCMDRRGLLSFSTLPAQSRTPCRAVGLYIVNLYVLISRGVPTQSFTVSCVRLVWATFHHITVFSKLASVTLKTNLTAVSFVQSAQENAEALNCFWSSDGD